MEFVQPAPALVSDTAVSAGTMEDEFRAFYERTARPLRAYLYRMTRDLSRADDILQESYLRYLQANLPDGMTGQHRKNYLFRIATNLLHDAAKTGDTKELTDCTAQSDVTAELEWQQDSARLLHQLTPRQRELLWLAYVEKFTHKEIAGMIGVGAASIAPMLAKARERFSEILSRGGFKRK